MKKISIASFIFLLLFSQLSCISSEEREETKIYQNLRESYIRKLLSIYPELKTLKDIDYQKLLAERYLVIEANYLMTKPINLIDNGQKKLLLLYLLAVKNPGHPKYIEKHFKKAKDSIDKIKSGYVPEP